MFTVVTISPLFVFNITFLKLINETQGLELNMLAWLCRIDPCCYRWFPPVWLLCSHYCILWLVVDPANWHCGTFPLPENSHKKSQGNRPTWKTAFVLLCLFWSRANVSFLKSFGQWLDWMIQEQAVGPLTADRPSPGFTLVYHCSATCRCVLCASRGRLWSGWGWGSKAFFGSIHMGGVINSFVCVLCPFVGTA